ncbi:MAG: hypothetical protein RLZZ626_156 [Actinomycetota bacterium]
MTTRFGKITFSRRLVAQLLILAGLASIGLWAWQGWGQNLLDAYQQRQLAADLDHGWSPAPSSSAVAEVPSLAKKPETDQVFARVLSPALGRDWVRPIAEGVSVPRVLDKLGTGHYPETQLPGEVGNFAIAGHRTTHGAAFNDLDKLRPGDSIYVETKDGFYRYSVVRNFTVWPSNRSVIAANPLHPGAPATERWMTLTTCTPKHTAEKRLVVQARFAAFTPLGQPAPTEIASLVAQL